jgi:AcrR family transcriptional regulator
MKRDTRTQILVATLSLFNENGEPNTTTNDIANEADISPGNLHYHFNKKSILVEALLAEFQADVRRVLEPPTGDDVTIDDFWAFLHLLLEVLAVYRFLFRDMETLINTYPKVSHALRGFAKGLTALMQLYLQALRRNALLAIDNQELQVVCRNLVVISLFSERFDEIAGSTSSSDVSAMRVAQSVLGILRPYASPDAAQLIAELSEHYS